MFDVQVCTIYKEQAEQLCFNTWLSTHCEFSVNGLKTCLDSRQRNVCYDYEYACYDYEYACYDYECMLWMHAVSAWPGKQVTEKGENKRSPWKIFYW